LLFITEGFVFPLDLAAIVVDLLTLGWTDALVVVGPRSRSEEVIVTTGFLAGAAETAGRWDEGSALDVGLLRVTAAFSFAGAGGGGGGIGTRRGPDDAEVAGIALTSEVIGRRWGATDVVARDITLAWERKGGTGI